MEKKVLLLNPPGKKRYVRDYYCSKVSKAWYVYPQVDLLIQSGILFNHFKIEVIDAIVENLNPGECLKKVADFAPDFIISLVGAVSQQEDFDFLRSIKRYKNIVMATGDFLLENGESILLNEDCLDAILLDFTSIQTISYFKHPEDPFTDIISKRGTSILQQARLKPCGEFSIPLPRHELFLNKRYAYPFIRRHPFATVLTDYGCPFKCKFCVMASLGYKFRGVENIMQEIRYLLSLGVKEIYFSDQTFGANRARTLELLRAMAGLPERLGWVCFTRADLTDGAVISAMKEAGCHTIIYGVESANREILNQFKSMGKERIIESIKLCKKYKIRVAGTFIIGLPQDTDETIQETIKFAKDNDFDYVSFNVAIPRANTALRQEAIASGIWQPIDEQMDQSGTFAVMGTGRLSKEEVLAWHKRAVREFYMRPRYLLGRLFATRSWQELKINFLEGVSLATSIFRNY